MYLIIFLANDGVPAHISPRELVPELMIDAKKHCAIVFGAYAQMQEPHDTTIASRATCVIALRPTGNAQRVHCFFNLVTG